ncbi:piggyBac transposable element-derived protein 4-like [Leptidea sinapis]|uniref:piggyBac transposable element-derived protein 4-like n=1 Tax=Leptidea sinapis TaxID=189913 RepID=UPI0021C28E31|nr:piggyBac transposable element-derived protein 4-like [Leptidea sinapis]
MTSSTGGRRILKARRSLPLQGEKIALMLVDSGSDADMDSTDEEDEEQLRQRGARLRHCMKDRTAGNVEKDVRYEYDDELAVEDVVVEGDESMTGEAKEIVTEDVNEMGGQNDLVPKVSMVFNWTDNFSSFTGQKETYQRNPGPAFSSNDPTEIFLKIWDEDVMGLIAAETNKYARQHIEQYTGPANSAAVPKYLEQWSDVTIQVLYQLFAVFIFMSLTPRVRLQDYWERSVIEMPRFTQIMCRNTFTLITKFLHFVSDIDSSVHGCARNICKVAPVLNHCNKKFSELYIPTQHICLDDSLLLWKGRLSRRPCIRSKADRFGIKSIDLCESATGYLLKTKFYTSKEMSLHPDPFHGFTNTTSKVVLELMDGYLDFGHILVMDNWFNQIPLTRYLKSRCTDVLGQINLTRKNIPQVMKDLKQSHVARGTCIASHCGDIALVTWSAAKLVTVVSTYHQHQMVPGMRAEESRKKPIAVEEYIHNSGGVALKDRKLSKFLFERNQCHKWYNKIFKRLLNTSILNAYIIYKRNSIHVAYSHRDFRMKVAEGLLARFGRGHRLPALIQNSHNSELRLRPGPHNPVNTEKMPNNQGHKRLYCGMCKARKKRTQVRLMCSLCQVALCVGECWADYHSLDNLTDTPRIRGNKEE